MAEIDFTSLNNLAKKKPAAEIFTPPAPPIESKPPEPRPAAKLQAEASSAGHALERARQVYKEYQANIMAAGTLQSEILKGAASGTDVCALLLTAAECIGRMTGDNGAFVKSLRNRLDERALRTLEPLPLAARMRATEERLEHLREAEQRAGTPEEARGIQLAIREHEGEIKAMEKMLEISGNNVRVNGK